MVEAADMLIASTDLEAKQLIELYDADPARVEVVHPGVDLDVFRPVPKADGPPGARPARGRRRPALRRPDPAAQGARRAAPGGGRAARARAGPPLPDRGPDRRRPVRHRARQAAGARRPGGRARPRRRGPLRPAGLAGRARPVVRRGDPGRRAVLQRVLRAGRGRGRGDRHPGRRRRGRRPDHGGPRRPQRPAGPGPPHRRLGRRPAARARPTTSCARGWRPARAGRPSAFSWDATAEATVRVYERARSSLAAAAV